MVACPPAGPSGWSWQRARGRDGRGCGRAGGGPAAVRPAGNRGRRGRFRGADGSFRTVRVRPRRTVLPGFRRHLQASYVFAAALVVGALLSGGWRLVWNRWFAFGALIAVAFTIPDIWWQAQHQWATVTMTQELNQANGGLGNVGTWVTGQLIIVSLALAQPRLPGRRLAADPQS
jgi:hypothetical protein